MVLEKSPESPLDSKEIIPGNPKRNQPYIFIRKTDAEAEALILWPSNEKSQLIEKDPELGKIQGRRRRCSTEDEMVGWHHQLNKHESEQTLRDSEGQGRKPDSQNWTQFSD